MMDSLIKIFGLTLLLSLTAGCSSNPLIYIYDTEDSKLIEVMHEEYRAPGGWVGNVEEISYTNSDDPFFITTQIYDRKKAGYIIKKRNYEGKTVAAMDLCLGESIDYTLDGGFCVNRNMSKGVILSYPKNRKYDESSKTILPSGPRDLVFFDFAKKTSKVISSNEPENGTGVGPGDKCYFAWLSNDQLLLCSNKNKKDQIVRIVDVSKEEIREKKIFTTKVNFHLSDDRQKIYYSYPDDPSSILRYYDISSGNHFSVAIPLGKMLIYQNTRKTKFEFRNMIYILADEKTFVFDMTNSSYKELNTSIFIDTDLEHGVACKNGLLLFYYMSQEKNDRLKEKYIFIPNIEQQKTKLIKAHDWRKLYVGYRGRYIIMAK